jgi:four helix bundle protein
MRGFRDLAVWQRSMLLVERIYRLTARFPDSERFGLVGQMRRAAVSVPSNIAEGHALKQTGAFLRHLAIASGSVAELQTQLEISRRLRFVEDPIDLFDELDQIAKMLTGLRRSVGRAARPME